MERAAVGDVELAYEVVGDGPRLVWLHGLASCMDGDRDVVDALAERFTVLAYDARGHGRSAPVYETERHSYPILADDLLAMLSHVGWDGAILAGSSMGGATAARAAMLSDRAAALVMVRPGAGGHDGAAPTWLQLIFAGGAHAIRNGGLDGAIEFLWSIPQARAQLEREPSRIEQLRTDWERHDPLSIAAALEAIPRTSPLDGGLRGDAITCPALVIPGDDVIHPREAGEAVAAVIPGARLLEPFPVGTSRTDEVVALVEHISAFVADEDALA